MKFRFKIAKRIAQKRGLAHPLCMTKRNGSALPFQEIKRIKCLKTRGWNPKKIMFFTKRSKVNISYMTSSFADLT